MTKYILSLDSKHRVLTKPDDVIHLAIWETKHGKLMVAANAEKKVGTVALSTDVIGQKWGRQVYSSGHGNGLIRKEDDWQLTLRGLGAVAYVA
jgi:hypothetical protein